MNKFETHSGFLAWCGALLAAIVVAGCGGGDQGRDPILGTGGIAVPPPMVTAVAPVNNATGVAVNNTIITAAFSKDMNPATLNTSTFTVTCPASAPVAGTVAYMTASRVATFTAAGNLPFSTTCAATITTGATDTTGFALANNFVWTFTTAAAPDVTRPRVILTVPETRNPGPTPGVPSNTAITAVFSEDMAPATITTASFTVTCPAPCVSPAGSVSYVVGSRTAVFTPTGALAAGTVYTATITTAATDLAGNALAGNQVPLPAASNYVWTFLTAGAIAPANISVLSTNPAAGANGVCPGTGINANFAVPSGARLDPSTVTAGTFTVTGSGPGFAPVIPASVTLDLATGRVATFTPQSALTPGITYIATIKGGSSGVRDLIVPGNVMMNDFSWTFTVGTATGVCAPPTNQPVVNLGSASSFGAFGGSALSATG